MKFSSSHEWVDLKGKIATVGITKEALSLLGEIVFVDLPSVGQTVEKDGPVALVEASKAASDIYSPLSGKIVEVNEELKKDPALLSKNDLKRSWLFRIELTHPSEWDLLMDEKAYKSYVKG